MKEVDTPLPSSEEIEFTRKYGTNSFQIWDQMSDQLKEEYFKIEELYSKFITLLRDYHEDLKYYAVMFRNIPLYQCADDFYSILFFASRYDEIIEYKNKIELTNDYAKNQILKLYIENEALFPKFCKKYVGVDFQQSRNLNTYAPINSNTLQSFYNGNYSQIFSVNDLNSDQCNVILSHSNNRHIEYTELYKEYLGESFKMRRYETDEDSLYGRDKRLTFVKDFYIPLLTNDKNKFILGRIAKFLIKYGLDKSAIFRDIDLLRHTLEQSLSLKSQISSIQRDIIKSKNDNESTVEINKQYQTSYISLLESELQYLKRSRFSSSLWNSSYTSSDLEIMLKQGINPKNHKGVTNEDIQKAREDIAKEKQRKLDIEVEIVKKEELLYQEKSRLISKKEELSFSLDRKINNMEYNIKNKENELNSIKEKTETELMNSDIFLFIFYNQELVFNYVESSVEKLYNLLWLRNPNKIQAIESLATSSSIYDLYYLFKTDSLEPRKNVPFRYIKNKKTGLIKLFFSQGVLMREWVRSFKENLEEEKRKNQEKKNAELRQQKLLAEEAERKRKAKYEFNSTNYSIRDSFLQFNKSNHQYSVNDRHLESVTQLIENLFPTFDKLSHARNTAAKQNMTIQQVLAMWEQKGIESRELGTLLHDKIEKYFLGRVIEEDETFKLFKQFAERFNLKPYRTEWAVYDEDSGIAGTIDFIDNTNNTYTIYDWKRSNKVIANGFPVKTSPYNERGNYPIEHLDNTPYWHYALQLSMYKYILEKNYNLNISRLRLGIFHPSYSKPYILEMPYLEKEVKLIANLRSDIIF